MTFLEVFSAVFTAQICVFIIERYFKKKMERIADHTDIFINYLVNGGVKK